ncbi:hypothetical protein ACRARG_00045 [Pseudooceanicola sp. C21-150M6]|uniref:hypothetical protein n=1 Tax=Pseudooceanicola sp. C21-150M6 TaxID=3434355 RepID=UPI003D7F41C3
MTHAKTIDRIIALHGETGAAPTRRDWESIMALPDGTPVLILNLLKFIPDTGVLAYGKFVGKVGPAFRAAGGRQIFYGPAQSCFGVHGATDWDAAILSEYPSASALAQMWLHPGFVEANKSRMDGLENSLVMVIRRDQARFP